MSFGNKTPACQNVSYFFQAQAGRHDKQEIKWSNTLAVQVQDKTTVYEEGQLLVRGE